MAVSVPREIYTLGAVQFNTQPLAQLQAQLMAKKAAKEEALNKYYSDLQGKINLAGVRTQDLQNEFGGILKDVEDWKQDWLKNKNEIAKGGLAQQQHLSRWQEILRQIEQSKGRVKTELTIGEKRAKGEYDPDDDDLKVQQKIGYAIQDPRSYKENGAEYGIGDLSPSIPNFDPARQNQFFSLITKGKEVGEIPDTTRKPIKEIVNGKETGIFIVPVKKEYSRDQIIGIANEAAELVKSIDPNNPTKAADLSARKYYSKVLNNPQSEEFVRLKNTYDNYFPGGIMDTPEEVAKAAAAIKAEGAGQTTTRRVNPDDWRERAFLQAFLKGGGSGQGEEKFVDYFSQIKELANAANRVARGTGAPLKELPEATQVQLIDFAKKITGNQEINQSKIYVKAYPDGQIYIMDADTNETIAPITERGINVPRQVGVPEKREAAGFAPAPKVPSKESIYTIKGKRYKEGELIKMGYTKQQIAPYLNK